VIPDDIAATDLDKDVRSELLSLSRDTADLVARHLVAAGQVIEEDAELAMSHAIAARRLASRIAAVREAVGLAAYAAGDWPTAIAELRTYHRMTGRQTHLAELADCERALGRPERAIDLYRGADNDALDKAGAIELLIVAAGARGDLGQHEAAVAMLQVRELTADEDAEWAARLRYAYADALLAAGRRDEAREWFARASAADTEGLTDAAERLLELDGVTLEDDEDESDEDGLSDEASASASDDEFEDDDEQDEDESDQNGLSDEASGSAGAGDEFEDDDDDSEDDESGDDLDDEFDEDESVDEDERAGAGAEDVLLSTAVVPGDAGHLNDVQGAADPVDVQGAADPVDVKGSADSIDVQGAADPVDVPGAADSADVQSAADAVAVLGSAEPDNVRDAGDPDDEKAAGDEFVAEAPAGDQKGPQA
jgi:tetratricopeptide (TPR) repeat protein